MTSQKNQDSENPSESGSVENNDAESATESAIEKSLTMLIRAVEQLDAVVDAQIEYRHTITDASEEVQRLASNSAKLAKELDNAETRAKRLSAINGEVSRRLVGAMEMVRTVLDQQNKGGL